jgi:ribonucleoside-diphosphate reductase beta chain
LSENPEIKKAELAKDLYEACSQVIGHEDAFIDKAFELGGVEGLEAESVKQYIRYIADNRLKQLELEPMYNILKNPLPYMDDMLNSLEHTNFFENRATEYSRAATKGTWEEAFT